MEASYTTDFGEIGAGFALGRRFTRAVGDRRAAFMATRRARSSRSTYSRRAPWSARMRSAWRAISSAMASTWGSGPGFEGAGRAFDGEGVAPGPEKPRSARHCSMSTSATRSLLLEEDWEDVDRDDPADDPRKHGTDLGQAKRIGWGWRGRWLWRGKRADECTNLLIDDSRSISHVAWKIEKRSTIAAEAREGNRHSTHGGCDPGRHRERALFHEDEVDEGGPSDEEPGRCRGGSDTWRPLRRSLDRGRRGFGRRTRSEDACAWIHRLGSGRELIRRDAESLRGARDAGPIELVLGPFSNHGCAHRLCSSSLCSSSLCSHFLKVRTAERLVHLAIDPHLGTLLPVVADRASEEHPEPREATLAADHRRGLTGRGPWPLGRTRRLGRPGTGP